MIRTLSPIANLVQKLIITSSILVPASFLHAAAPPRSLIDVLIQNITRQRQERDQYDNQLYSLDADINKHKREKRAVHILFNSLLNIATRKQMGIENDMPPEVIDELADYISPQESAQWLDNKKKQRCTTANQKKLASIKLKQKYSQFLLLPLTGLSIATTSSVWIAYMLADYHSEYGMSLTKAIKYCTLVPKELLQEVPLFRYLFQAFSLAALAYLHNLYQLYKYTNADEYTDTPMPPVRMINGIKTCVGYLALDFLSYLHKSGRLQFLTNRLPIDKCKNNITATVNNYRTQCDNVLRAYIPRYIRYKKKLKRAGRRLQRMTPAMSLSPAKREWAIKTAIASFLACEQV